MSDEQQRQTLISICERAIVNQDKWDDRDSSAAHKQLGVCWSLLKAGCDFHAMKDPDRETLWVQVSFRGFNWFEYGDTDDGYDPLDNDRFYLPTVERLNAADGGDWY